MTREGTAYQLLASGIIVAVLCHACDWASLIGGATGRTSGCIVESIMLEPFECMLYRERINEAWPGSKCVDEYLPFVPT